MILKSYSLIATKSIRKHFYIQPFKILITGGLGFIGSHTAVALIAAGHDIVIVDNLSNSKVGVLDSLKTITGHAYFPFVMIDVTDFDAMDRLFAKHNFDGVIHSVDGMGVRDFIHVMDLAEEHVAALENPQEGVQVYNLGTGKGTSVLELIQTFEQVNQVEIPYEIVNRRSGDCAESVADVSKAEREHGWKATRSLEDMCRDSWGYIEKSRDYS